MKICIKIAKCCLQSKKICGFDENYGTNHKIISVFDLIFLPLKKMSLQKSFHTHY